MLLFLLLYKNPDSTHPHRQKELVQLVNQHLNGRKTINSYDILCVRKIFKIDESKPNYYYKSKFATPQFSNAFVDWLVDQFNKDDAFFDKARQKYKNETNA